MTSGDVVQYEEWNAPQGRGYVFALHGASIARPRRSGQQQPRSQRRQSRQRRLPYVPSAVDQFELTEFADPERNAAVFRMLAAEGGPAPGIDGVTYPEFSGTELFSALRHQSRTILERTYLPQETRLVQIPKGDGRYRELQLLCILDRVVAKALQLALDPYWRTQLPRLGQDPYDVFAQLELDIRRHDAYFLRVSDIRDCFPSVPIDVVLDCHRNHFRQPDLLWLTETVVQGHDGSGHPIGLYQGSPYSPVSTELTLHTYLDVPFGTRHRGFPFLRRYVDNLNIVCRNEREGQEALQTCEELLVGLGFALKPEPPPIDQIMDLRISDPNRKVLGLNPYWLSGQLHFAVPESAYENLKDRFVEAAIAISPLETAKWVARGWLGAVGPALTNSAKPEVVARVIRTARECGFTELGARDLQEIGHQARARWLSRVEEWRSRECV